MKAANKGAKAPAELPEGRASTKGNSQDQSTYRTQGRVSVSQAVERIRQAATRKPQEKLTALLHHITTDALRCAFYDLKKTASAGVDGLVWTGYEDGLEERLLDLHGRVHSGAYRALPSRRVEIPKPDGGTRPLGIAALEDKIVQKAVVDVILTSCIPSFCQHQITPKTSRHTRCSMSMFPNVSINGRIRSSGQLGRWWYSISPCRNNECVRRFTVFAFNQRS